MSFGVSVSELDLRRAAFALDHRRGLVGVLVGLVLVPAFGFLDLIAYPDDVTTLWIIRGAITLLLVPAYLGIRWSQSYRGLTFWLAFAAVVTGGGIAAMIHAVDGHHSPYYAGICLVFVTVGVLVTSWPMAVCGLVFGTLLAAYFAPIALFDRPIHAPTLVTHSFFLVSIALVSFVSVRLRAQLATQELLAREQLAASKRQLEELHRTKDRLFQNISHEFRTPMTLILVPVERLLGEETGLSERSRSVLMGVRRNAYRALAMINDLMDLARLDATDWSPTLAPVHVGDCLRTIGTDVADFSAHAGVRLELSVPPELPCYRLNGIYLEKIVLNLLSNALKFTPRGGSVRLTAAGDDAGLSIEVTDTGSGIPFAWQERIFQRFEQVDGGSTRRHGGSGVGLALARELAEAMGGSLTLSSSPGRGARFILRFPPALACGAEERMDATGDDLISEMSRRALLEAIEPKVPAAIASRSDRRGARILLAEDDPDLRRELCEILAPHHRVTAVSDGLAALETATRLPPDVLISDVMMPGLDGVQLTSTLRASPAMKDTAIVLLSALADVHHRVAGRKVGADSYLVKPFHPDELLATIEGLLRSRMRIVGDYLLGERLDSGGHGDVHVAEHVRTGEKVAVKLLQPHLAKDPVALGRLQREAEILQRVRHANVVRVLEQGAQEGRAYLVMELLEGMTLRALVDRRGGLPSEVVAAIGLGISDGIEAIHSLGIVHRDLKCENVMVLADGASLASRVRLIDFGIGRGEDHVTLTRDGTVPGTISYLAPEVLRGEGHGPASDIFATGVILYTLAAGKPPFTGEVGDALARAHQDAAPPRIRDVRPEVDAGLDDAVAHALAFSPADRLGSARDLRLALEGLRLPPAELVIATEEVATVELPKPAERAHRLDPAAHREA